MVPMLPSWKAAPRLPRKGAELMGVLRHGLFTPMFLWLAVIVVALATRPPLPVDETRYLAVAWDMWLEGHYLVPHLNGAPYSHKPPLLFWLMTGGWHLFGVNEWWPRLVAPLFGLGSLILTFSLSRALWPKDNKTWHLAPVLLFGALFWCVFMTLTMFDMMLAFFTLTALSGFVDSARHGSWRGFLIAGIATGFGVLAKGPAILLHVLPVMLTAPWWMPALSGLGQLPKTSQWYAGAGITFIVTITISLVWAIPAGLVGGEAYRNAIFWGQSAGRMVQSFAHARPFWWYAVVFPALVLPWLFWPPIWRATRRFGDVVADGGVRLCLVWFGTAFIIFSLISGKQLHYLLPEFPALALIAAHLLHKHGENTSISARWDSYPPAGLAMVAGGLLIAAPHLPLSGRTASMINESASIWGGLIIASGAVALLSRGADRMSQASRLAAISAFAVMAIYLAAVPVLAKRYDLGVLAGYISALQNDGKAIAYFGKYHGQFHFMGRLKSPITSIGLLNDDIEEFLAAYPDGIVIAKYDTLPLEATPLFTYLYRNYTYAAWPAATLTANPGLGERR